LLWGFWADRLAEATRGCLLTVVGAEVEPAESSSGFGASWQLALPPRGAKPTASILVVCRSGAAAGSSILVTASGIKHSTPADPARAIADLKRPRAGTGSSTSSVEYLSIAEMSDPSSTDRASRGRFDFGNVFGVVVEYSLPRTTRSKDLRSVLHLADESCVGTGQHLVASFFKGHPHVPGVGAVIRLHRLGRSSPYAGVPQAMSSLATQWVFGDGAEADANRSSAGATWTAADSARVAQLQAWSRQALSAGPFSTFHDRAHTLASAYAHALAVSPRPAPASPTDVTLDLIVQLAPFPDSAAVAAASPSRHGAGSAAADARLLPIACFRDGPRAGSVAGGSPVLAPMFVMHALHADITGLLLRHLSSPPAETATAGPTRLEPAAVRAATGAPTGSAGRAGASATSDRSAGDPAAQSAGGVAGAAAASSSPGDAFSGGWVRLRSVQLSWSLVQGMCIVYTETSTAMHLPDHHAEVTHNTGGQAALSSGGLTSQVVGSAPALLDRSRANAIAVPHSSSGHVGQPPRAGAACVRFAQFEPDANAGSSAFGSFLAPSNEIAAHAVRCGPPLPLALLSSSSAVGCSTGAPPGALLQSVLPLPTPPTFTPQAPQRHVPAPAPACTTLLQYPHLKLLSIMQAQDLGSASLPQAFRLRARVVRALPTDAACWALATVPSGEPSAAAGAQHHQYRLVLHLADEDEPSALLGLLLEGAEAARFFSALAPCDLRASNVSRSVLERLVHTLCASPPLEFGVMAYRPAPEGAFSLHPPHQSVCYRIVGTELHCPPSSSR
jgi:hypothetical protein